MTRRRPTWPDLPDAIRALIEDRLGATVVDWVSHDGGYSPGPALTLLLADGDRMFVKGADAAHPDAARFHRREAQVAAALPATLPSPRLRWVAEASGWVVLAFDAVAGRTPQVPWVAQEVDAVARLITQVAQTPAPAGLAALADHQRFDGWRNLAADGGSGLETYPEWVTSGLAALAEREAAWPDAVAGDRLVHHDLRGDNVLITPSGEAVVVDWPHAAAGAAFCDLVGWLPSLALEGGPAPSEMMAAHPVGRAADPRAVTTFLVALTGYFVHASLQPDPPGIPHVRAFQRAQADVCLPWLRERLGW